MAAAPAVGNSQSPNVDKTAPKVTLVAKSLKASKKGAVSFTVGCPATEATCQITLKLKNGAKTVASKTVTIKGGKTKTVTLQLNKAMRQQLKHRSMKVSSVLTATDAAGNKKTTSKKVDAAQVLTRATPRIGPRGERKRPDPEPSTNAAATSAAAFVRSPADLPWCRGRRSVGMGR